MFVVEIVTHILLVLQIQYKLGTRKKSFFTILFSVVYKNINNTIGVW
jgi:hypothetical protein